MNCCSVSHTDDLVLPFQIESTPMRGRLVRLGPSIDMIIRQHDYPHEVASLLAQAVAVAAALGTALKFDGVFTLQTKTNGPLRMLVVDVTLEGAVRACAQYDREQIARRKDGDGLLGGGHLVFTLDQKIGEERYQGIVQIENDQLTEAFQLYFKKSEQIPTGLIAFSRQDAQGVWHSGCLMLQRMPVEGGSVLPPSDTSVEDAWLRVMALMQTCTGEELTDPCLPPEDLLFRLFHEDGVRVYEAKPLRHECRCSSAKIRGLLEGLPKEEVQAMKQEDGLISVTCQFCNKTYRFTDQLEEVASL